MNCSKEQKKKYNKQYRKNHKKEIYEYNKQYSKDNLEKISEMSKRYYLNNIEKISKYNKNNKEKISEYNKQWRKNNKEKISEYKKQYRINNYNKIVEGRIKYKGSKKEQTPDLTKKEQVRMRKIYKISQYLGLDYHVDHIIPLSKGGIHHPDNLQIIPSIENMKKSSKLNYVVQQELVIDINKYKGGVQWSV